jgi:hypothetical protein
MAEAKAKMSATRKARGTLVPGTRLWTAEEDEMARTLPPAEVARQSGRSVAAVWIRRGVVRRQGR